MFDKHFNWFLLATFLLITLYFIRVSPNAFDYDSYYHLSIGRQVWMEKSIPTEDKFVYGAANNHISSSEWLSGLIFYSAYNLVGDNEFIFLRLLTGLGALYFFYLTLKLIGTRKEWILAALLSVGYIMAIRLLNRPEIFSLLFVSIVNYLCFYYYIKKKLNYAFLILPLIFLLWPNLHGFTPIGFAIFSIWYFFILFKRSSFSSFKYFLGLWTLSLVLIIAQLGRLFFAFQVFSPIRSAENMSFGEILLRVRGNLILHAPIGAYIYIAVVVLYLIGCFFYFKKNKLKSLPLFTIFYFILLLLPIKFFRTIPLTLLVTTPSLLILLSALPKKLFSKAGYTIFFVFLILFVVAIREAKLVGLRSEQYVFDGGNYVVSRDRGWTRNIPAKSVEIIQAFLNSKKIFSDTYVNNYLIWKQPGVKVYDDAIFTVYSSESDRNRFDEIRLGRSSWKVSLENLGIDTVINSTYFDSLWRSEVPVFILPNWKLIYLDENATVYARSDIIKSIPIDLSAIHPEMAGEIKFDSGNSKVEDQLTSLMDFEPKNAFARRQLILYYLQKNDPAKAQFLANESQKILPDDPWFYYYSAKISYSGGNCPEGNKNSSKVMEKSFGDPLFKILLKDSKGSCY